MCNIGEMIKSQFRQWPSEIERIRRERNGERVGDVAQLAA